MPRQTFDEWRDKWLAEIDGLIRYLRWARSRRWDSRFSGRGEGAVEGYDLEYARWEYVARDSRALVRELYRRLKPMAARAGYAVRRQNLEWKDRRTAGIDAEWGWRNSGKRPSPPEYGVGSRMLPDDDETQNDKGDSAVETDIVNLTPHTLNIYNEHNELVLVLPPSGSVARIAMRRTLIGREGDVPLYTTEYGELTGLPDVVSRDKIYVVSAMARDAARSDFDPGMRFASPGDLIRNDEGQPIGCVGLTF